MARLKIKRGVHQFIVTMSLIFASLALVALLYTVYTDVGDKVITQEPDVLPSVINAPIELKDDCIFNGEILDEISFLDSEGSSDDDYFNFEFPADDGGILLEKYKLQQNTLVEGNITILNNLTGIYFNISASNNDSESTIASLNELWTSRIVGILYLGTGDTAKGECYNLLLCRVESDSLVVVSNGCYGPFLKNNAIFLY